MNAILGRSPRGAQPNPCDLCDGTRFRVIYANHPILDGPLVKCEGCGLVQVNPRRGRYQVADAESFQARTAAYAQQARMVRDHLHYRPDVEDAERTVRERLWSERLARIERSAPTGRLLEIGSDGQFLRLAASRGWSVTGVQPDVEACASAATLHGINLISATLREAGFPDCSFDAIAMFHVIEHVPSPRALLHETLRVLRPGGVLFTETPNVDTFWFRILGARWRQLIPDHYWFFSPTTLRALLTRVGYVIDRVESVGKAASMRLLLNRAERMARVPLPALGKLLTRLGLSDRVVWIKPGDIVLVTARRPGA